MLACARTGGSEYGGGRGGGALRSRSILATPDEIGRATCGRRWGGLRRVFDRLFGDIDLSRSLYLLPETTPTAHTAHITYCTLSLPAHPLVGYASFK